MAAEGSLEKREEREKEEDNLTTNDC